MKQRMACATENEEGNRNTLQSLKEHVNDILNGKNLSMVLPQIEASRRSKFDEFLKLSSNEKNGRIAEFCWKLLLQINNWPVERLKSNLSRCERCRSFLKLFKVKRNLAHMAAIPRCAVPQAQNVIFATRGPRPNRNQLLSRTTTQPTAVTQTRKTRTTTRTTTTTTIRSTTTTVTTTIDKEEMIMTTA